MVRTPLNLALVAGAMALGTTFVAAAADAPAAAPAAAPPPVLVSGANGQMLAETCAGCHGTDGLSGGPASPSLAGINAEYFAEVMKDFRDGKAYSTIMGRIAKGYSDDELKLMAEYFNGKPYKSADQSFDAALAAKGAKLHDKYCEKCHGDGGKILVAGAKGKEKDADAEEEEGEGDEEYQILAGQWTPYLQYAMEDFREGRSEMPKKMKSKVKDLIAKHGDKGLEAIFAFYASEK
jgi:cytochrome subunit of sulfide dehydrogenase